MSFLVRNEGFLCAYCGAENPPASQTCRNHCRQCLCSQHVDRDSPGDRLSSCQGKMRPRAVEHDAKREWMIVHECEKCGKKIRNKRATDDAFEVILTLTGDTEA